MNWKIKVVGLCIMGMFTFIALVPPYDITTVVLLGNAMWFVYAKRIWDENR